MPASVINDRDVTDPDLLKDKTPSPATAARFGSRFLARGGAHGVLEGCAA